MSEKALEAIGDIRKEAKLSSDAASRKYEERFVGFNAVKGRFWVGKYQKPLKDADFYKTVGRPDLAAKYEGRAGTRIMLNVVGLTAAGLGIVVGVSAVNDRDRDKDSTGVTWALVGGGLGIAAIGWAMNPHPVPPSEIRRLTDEHNQKLRQELSLDAIAARRMPRARTVELRFAPAITPEFQGGVLEGRF